MQPSRCVELVGQKGPNVQAGWLMAFRAGGLIYLSLEVLQMFSGGQLDHGKCDEFAGSSMLHIPVPLARSLCSLSSPQKLPVILS